MIKYLGSKRLLIPKIVEIVKNESAKKVLDLFSGTSRVGHALQNEGITTWSNDITTYGLYLAFTHVMVDKEKFQSMQKIIDELNQVEPNAGWFTKTYCEDANFFHPKNGAKIEAIRNYIEAKLKPWMHTQPSWAAYAQYRIAIVSLIEAADRVDSTCGVQMAYLKDWAKRANNDLELRMPDMSKGVGGATQLDAKEAAKRYSNSFDLVYMDPPYNQHNYLGNYHIWETLCLWDNPETYGKAQKRVDIKTRKSPWNSKKQIKPEFEELISLIESPKVLVSFNNEGYMTQDEIYSVLDDNFSTIEVIEVPYKRYVGAKIGIHNKNGEKVGKISHTENKELLFLAKR